MWTKEQLKMLKAKGVEDAVILALMFDEDEDAAAPAAAPEQVQEPAAPEPVKAEPEKPAAPDLASDKILAAIERLTGAVQASNIRNITGTEPQRETAEDVLAAMINPKGEK